VTKVSAGSNIQELGSGAVRERIAAGDTTILIPLGSCERHGNPHTPLGLDGLVTLAVVERAARAAGVLHAPLVPFGYTPHHMGPPGEGLGTVSLSGETYRRLLEDVGRSLVHHGFDRLVFVSFHSFNAVQAQDALLALHDETGAFAAFYGGRESERIRGLVDALPERLSSEIEAATAMALLGERFSGEDFLSHSYDVRAPEWLGPGFSKAAGTGLAVSYNGSELIVGMHDFEFVRPVRHDEPVPSRASAELGRRILDAMAEELAELVGAVRSVSVERRARGRVGSR
jgi:creatinine amidohydrolase